MIKKLPYFFLFLLWSCDHSGKDNHELLDEFSFSDNDRVILPSDHSHAFAFVESDTLRSGDTYRAKLFLANRTSEYDESLKPFFKLYQEHYKYWEDLVNEGDIIESINDTAYVKFVVQDDELKKGHSKVKKWHATIFIPLQNGDTTHFGLTQEYVVLGK